MNKLKAMEKKIIKIECDFSAFTGCLKNIKKLLDVLKNHEKFPSLC